MGLFSKIEDPKELIKNVQTWSDDHEEKERLSVAEYNFLTTFSPRNEMFASGWEPEFYEIERRKSGELWLRIERYDVEPVVVPISINAFKFIEPGTKETFAKLLTRDVDF